MAKTQNISKKPDVSRKPAKQAASSDKMPMTAKGIRLLLAGVIVIFSGFILLSGGGSDDPEVFNYAMFDFRRLYAAPIVIIVGIVIEIIAIMRCTGSKE